MEYVAAGDVDAENTHMLSTGGMLTHARESDADTFIVATETGMLHPLEQENPARRFVPANRAAVCQYMKMITLPKLRDALRDGGPVVTVDRRSPSARGCRSSAWSRSTDHLVRCRSNVSIRGRARSSPPTPSPTSTWARVRPRGGRTSC